MKPDFFKDIVNAQFQAEGNKMYQNNSELVLGYFRDKDSTKFELSNFSDVQQGKMYFILYDLDGKSSKMEKYNPLFVVDFGFFDNTKWIFALNINFIPVAIRVIVFNQIFNASLDMFDDIDKSPIKQEPVDNITFGVVYKMLKSLGFEWAIRKFDYKKVNQIYSIDLNIAYRFVTMSTAKLTGVDDGKLIDIWKKKLATRKEREKKMIGEILGDYKKMQEELKKNSLSLSEKENELYKSVQFLKTI